MGNNDLISRAEAIDVIRSMTISLGGAEIFHPEAKKSVLSALDDLAAEDAVPVVRCKNCRNWDRTRRTPSGSHFCFCTMMHTAENHYCGHGAKMDGENECSDG